MAVPASTHLQYESVRQEEARTGEGERDVLGAVRVDGRVEPRVLERLARVERGPTHCAVLAGVPSGCEDGLHASYFVAVLVIDSAI
jgi:hypothetical protein